MYLTPQDHLSSSSTTLENQPGSKFSANLFSYWSNRRLSLKTPQNKTLKLGNWVGTPEDTESLCKWCFVKWPTIYLSHHYYSNHVSNTSETLYQVITCFFSACLNIDSLSSCAPHCNPSRWCRIGFPPLNQSILQSINQPTGQPLLNAFFLVEQLKLSQIRNSNNYKLDLQYTSLCEV